VTGIADGVAPPGSGPGEESAWDTAVSTANPAHFRPDIEGLRAVAILAVLAYHTHIPGVAGGFVGVDVFFVISGFLITGLLLREFAASRRIDLPAFYARRARRLLPAALIVIVVTVGLSAFALSRLQFPEVASDGAAAALYVSNYRFALNATDYFAVNTTPSPLLHYWSLGVEEQFYLFWPLLILVCARVLSVRRLWIVVLTVALGSLALSVAVTNIEAPWAFYSLPTRTWQLALGALVALGLLALPGRWSTQLASGLGIVGVAMIVAAVMLIDQSTPYPGFAALVPAVGTALVIIAGERPGAVTARLLASRVPRWFGRISYSLYLWHWPLLILVPVMIGHGSLRVRIVLAIVAIVVAAFSTRFIETPFRAASWSRLKSRRTLGISGGASVAVAAFALLSSGTLFSAPTTSAAIPTLPPPSSVKPALPTPVLSGPLPADLQPPLTEARKDKAGVTSDGCETPITESQPRDCVYGDPAAATTVVVFGDSHAGMWLPAIQALALERHWRVVPLIKPACTPVDVSVWRQQLNRPFHECDAWRDLAIQKIAGDHPAIVFFASSSNYHVVDAHGDRISNQSQVWREGMISVLERLKEDTTRLIVIGMTPRHASDPLECLAQNDLIQDCLAPRSELVDTKYLALEADAAHRAGADLISTTEWLCQPSTCALVMGRYLVYRDKGHLTATIATVLAPQFRWALDHLP
jgi:peptidoglycan/LPS O-acetylase OafA/YrhL